MNETQRKQVPWEHSALTGRFYFKEPTRVIGGTSAAWQLSEAAEAWDRTKDATNIAALQLFATRYKDTFYAELARLRIEELKAPQAAVAASSSGLKQVDKRSTEEETKRMEQAERDFQEGQRYRFGGSVPQDYAKAHELYQNAAAAGNGNAMNNLGLLYERGLGVPTNYTKAYELYEKAAAAGNSYGMNNLGRFYDDGNKGVAQDLNMARAWFEKAAAAGNRFGMVNLASLPEKKGSSHDFARGAKLLLEKAKARNDEIMRDLFGDMGDWPGHRTELKRELTRLGVYNGPIDDKWDNAARTAVIKYLGQASTAIVFDGVWKGMWGGTGSTEIKIVGNKVSEYTYLDQKSTDYQSKVEGGAFQFGNDHMTITMLLVRPDQAVARYQNVKGEWATATLARH